ncbi:conserved hypothetical protein [uncultured Desulfatiglans sp.]|uniref:Uncharacterized protein n=1 Tax=Uncultured Desulfatiglans sp. TaxID=1748965 RepID=A0A653A417_UNCDX|nr:conserved hypothetical protein [uncultured Desulfatiglans sp.]
MTVSRIVAMHPASGFALDGKALTKRPGIENTVVRKESDMDIEPGLVATLRQGVEIIKAIVYKNLRNRQIERHPLQSVDFTVKLCGAMVNELFGTPNPDPSFTAFREEQKPRITAELHLFAATMPEMRIPLTDALRIQFLCDNHEGVDSGEVLARADALNLLLRERELPLPGSFMQLARRLGVAYEILAPESLEEEAMDAPPSPRRH